jgi:subtilisin family serine protease
MERRRRAIQLLLSSALLLTGLVALGPRPVAAAQERVPSALRHRALQGQVRVIVEVDQSGVPQGPEGGMPGAAIAARRSRIGAAQGQALGGLRGLPHRVVHQFRTVPYLALEIDSRGLTELEASPAVRRVFEDRLLKPVLAESAPQIGADLAWDAGFDGAGTVVAVIDSGVDKTHPFLANKVVAEGCFSSRDTGSAGDCPNGQTTQIGSGAGVPCDFAPFTCSHGTHVAGIAAGNGDAMSIGFSGVAKGAGLISVQVFHSSFTECLPFFEEFPCARAFSSDIGAALEYVYELRSQYVIAAANMSLGGGSYTSTCDGEDPQITAVIANLRSVGIPTVTASGNDGEPDAISFPACVTGAVSVGSVDKTDEVSYFSNISPLVSLLAPGGSILSSVPGGDFDVYDGTSMAAPHVAGAWAILKQATPDASVDQLLSLLQQTGVPITDTRYGIGHTKPRINVAGAMGIEYPLPVLDSISPATVTAWGPDLTLTVHGNDFARASRVQVNGIVRPTTYVSKTTLTAIVPTTDLSTTASGLSITVFSPAPGGGTSEARTLALTQPSLTVSATTVAAGGPVTVTLVDGPGGGQDWLALAAAGAPDGPNQYVQWVYVGAGVTTRTWTVNAPSAPGQYEFRFFANGNYVRAATSPAFTVPAPPPPTLTVSATTVPAGGQVTVTLTNGPGGATDWLGFTGVGTPDGSGQYLQWVYVGTGVTTRTWTVTVPTTPGQYEFRFFPNGGFTRLATSPAVTVTPLPPSPATLTVNTTTVAPGGQVTVTLTNGPGGASDWLGFTGVATPDGSGQYLQWVYVGAGITTRTWTVTVPNTPGQYEFRLFLNGGYTPLVKSPAVTVTAPPPPPPGSTPTLTVSAATVPPGGQVTVTLANGRGGAQDWLAFAAVGAPPNSYLQWVYVGASVTTRTWTVTAPTAPGQYEFRLFLNNGYTLAATSPAVTVTAPPPSTAALTVSATTVAPGGQVTVTLTNGPGGASDWLGFTGVGTPDGSGQYLQWVYVGAGITTRTWTVTVPTTPGQYEFRLFLNGGYTPLVKSPTVTVPAPEPPSGPPTLAVSATAVARGGQVTVTLTNGLGGAQDWLALATVGAPGNSYLQWVYVGANLTTRTWTVTMPSAPGQFEFRLFLNNGYTLAATSPPVTVGP